MNALGGKPKAFGGSGLWRDTIEPCYDSYCTLFRPALQELFAGKEVHLC